ncbi:MAG: sortase [Eubacteriales bacterium]|nr:sortase [Eubacteriales bacterium]
MKSNKKNTFDRIKELLKRMYVKYKPHDSRDAVRLVVLAIAIPVFIYSAGQLIYKLYQYQRDDKNMAEVVDLKPDTGKNPFKENNEKIDDESVLDLPYEVLKGTDSYLNKDGILAEYADLKSMNADFVGWINFPGFEKPIDFPMVYSGDNSFYLRRDFNKNDSQAGSIFLDGSNDPYHEDPLNIDRNYVIYGHAMRNKSMFGYLTDYWGNEKSRENSTIYIDLLNTRLEYEVISTFLCQPDYNYRQTRFLSDDQYLDYLNRMIEESDVEYDVSVTADDKIITLSTCYKSTRRTAIIAKLVKQIIYSPMNHNDLDNIDIKDPVAIPTHLPFDVPIPTPRLTPEPTLPENSSEVSSGVSVEPSPSDLPEPTVEILPEPTPPVPMDLIFDPDLDDQNEAWLPYQEDDNSYYIDVTDVLTEQGPGKYWADAMVFSQGAVSDFKFSLILEYNEINSIFVSDIYEIPADEWNEPGTDEDFLYSMVDESKIYSIDWGDHDLDSAVLLITFSSTEAIAFDFKSIRFFKEGVYEPTPEITPVPTTEPTVDPTAEPSAEPTGEPAIEPTIEITPEPTIATSEPVSSEQVSDDAGL